MTCDYKITSARLSGDGSYGQVYVVSISNTKTGDETKVALKVCGRLGESIDTHELTEALLIDGRGSHVKEYFMQRLVNLTCGSIVSLRSYGIWMPNFYDSSVVQAGMTFEKKWKRTDANPMLVMEPMLVTAYKTHKHSNLFHFFESVAPNLSSDVYRNDVGIFNDTRATARGVHAVCTSILFPAIALRKMCRLSQGVPCESYKGKTPCFPTGFGWFHGDIKDDNIGVTSVNKPKRLRITFNTAIEDKVHPLRGGVRANSTDSWSEVVTSSTRAVLLDMGLTSVIQFSRPEEAMWAMAVGYYISDKKVWTPRKRASEMENSRMSVWGDKTKYPDYILGAYKKIRISKSEEDLGRPDADLYDLYAHPHEANTPKVRERMASVFDRFVKREGAEVDNFQENMRRDSAAPDNVKRAFQEELSFRNANAYARSPGLLVTEWYRSPELILNDLVFSELLDDKVNNSKSDDFGKKNVDNMGPLYGMDPHDLNMSHAYMETYDRYFCAEASTADMYSLGITALRVFSPGAFNNYFQATSKTMPELAHGLRTRVDPETTSWHRAAVAVRMALYIALRFYQARLGMASVASQDDEDGHMDQLRDTSDTRLHGKSYYHVLSTETLQAAAIMDELVIHRVPGRDNTVPELSGKRWDSITDRDVLVQRLESSPLSTVVTSIEEHIAYQLDGYTFNPIPSARVNLLSRWKEGFAGTPSGRAHIGWVSMLLGNNIISMLHFAPGLRKRAGDYDRTVRMMSTYLAQVSGACAWDSPLDAECDVLNVDIGDMPARFVGKTAEELFSLGPTRTEDECDPMPKFIFDAIHVAKNHPPAHSTHKRSREWADGQRRAASPHSTPEVPSTGDEDLYAFETLDKIGAKPMEGETHLQHQERVKIAKRGRDLTPGECAAIVAESVPELERVGE